MHKNDGTNYAPGNEFQDAIPRSLLGSKWLNTIQRELVAVVEAAGIVLSDVVDNQLLQAIRNLSYSTGDVKFTLKAVADTGWIMADDGTIGNAASGATTRANADTVALFTLLWNNVADANAPVSGGRGANAAADYAANKTIGLTKMLGRALGVAGAGAGLTARALGVALGEETHVLTEAEMPSHTHQSPDGNNFVTEQGGSPRSQAGANADDEVAASNTTAATGSDDPHNNMQPTSFLNVMIRL